MCDDVDDDDDDVAAAATVSHWHALICETVSARNPQPVRLGMQPATIDNTHKTCLDPKYVIFLQFVVRFGRMDEEKHDGCVSVRLGFSTVADGA